MTIAQTRQEYDDLLGVQSSTFKCNSQGKAFFCVSGTEGEPTSEVSMLLKFPYLVMVKPMVPKSLTCSCLPKGEKVGSTLQVLLKAA